MSFTISVDGQVIPNNGIISNIIIWVPPLPWSISDKISSVWFDWAVRVAYYNESDMILSGDFKKYNNIISFGNNYVNWILKLKQDAKIDGTFRTWKSVSWQIYALYKWNGYILIGWLTTDYDGNPYKWLIKIFDNWYIDSSFILPEWWFDWAVNVITQIWTDIYVWWSFTNIWWVSYGRIVRLNQYWSIDTSFNVWLWFNNTVYDIKVDTNGKLIVSWSFTTYNWSNTSWVVRLQTDWSIDTSFNIWTWIAGTVKSIAIQSDNKILLWWTFTEYNGNSVGNIVRIQTDWSYDSSFAQWTGFDAWIEVIKLLWTDIFVGNNYANYNGNLAAWIAKIDSSWWLYTTFCNNVSSKTNYSNTIYDIIFEWTDIIAVWAIWFYGTDKIGNIIKLDSSGNYIDYFWEIGTYSPYFESYSCSTKKIIYDWWYYYIAWYNLWPYETISNYNGNFLNRFAQINYEWKVLETLKTWYWWSLYAIIKSDDGKYLCVTQWDSFDTTYRSIIWNMFKIGIDWTVDTSINVISSWLANLRWLVNCPWWNNKAIAVFPSSTQWNWTVRNRIVKFDTMTWAIDTSFTYTTWFNSSANSIIIDSLWWIYIVWWFTSYNWATGNNRIIKLLPNGTKDTSFNNSVWFNSTVNKVFQATWWIYVTSSASRTYKWANAGFFWKILSSWDIDLTFQTNIGTWPNWQVNDIIEYEGKIYLFWTFTTWNGIAVNRAVSLNMDWTINNIFWSWFNDAPQSCMIKDNIIYVFWLFTSYNNIQAPYWISIHL